jgi:hypothetical protein
MVLTLATCITTTQYTHQTSSSRINWIWLVEKTWSEYGQASSLWIVSKLNGKKYRAVERGLPQIQLHFSGYLLYLSTHNIIVLQLQFFSCCHLLCTVDRFLLCVLLLLEISVSVRKFDSFDRLQLQSRLNSTSVEHNNSTITQIQHKIYTNAQNLTLFIDKTNPKPEKK